jgi:poly(3-hydroxybutyrate) depolymerase
MKKLVGVACLVLAVAQGGRAWAQNGPLDPYGGMEGRIFDTGTGFKLPYRLGKPSPYDPAVKYPLVVFLHGSGESGVDNRLQISKNIGNTTPGSVFTTAANQAKFPTFFIAPQSPYITVNGVKTPEGWTSGSDAQKGMLKLIPALEAELSIDPNRLYVTGLSLGGNGTWIVITENPTLFAAAIPMSGGGDPTMAAKIVKIPIWDFHGTLDPSIPVASSRDMISALRALGGSPRYTEYPNGMHDIWFMAYTTPELLPWMNAQRLGVQDPTADPTRDGGVPIPEAGAPDAKPTNDGGVEASGAGGAAGAGGGGGAPATTGVGGSGGASGSGAAGNGTMSGAAGNGTTTGAAGAAGATGAAGSGGVAHGGSGGGCALAGRASLPKASTPFAVILIALSIRRRRRRRAWALRARGR